MVPQVAQRVEAILPKQSVKQEIAKKTGSLPPIFSEIARCESGGSQFYKNGKVIRGHITPNDIGKYQINMNVWGATAKRLGINVYTAKGNEQMALHIYNLYGTKPWSASKHCWKIALR